MCSLRVSTKFISTTSGTTIKGGIMKSRAVFVLGVLLGYAVLVSFGPHQAFAQKGMAGIVERGRYLVEFGGCSDCHSPKVFGPNGPMFDTTKLLSGAPSASQVPSIPEGILGPGKWGALTTPDLTTWVGPWGVSFARNLTPDKETGLGSWTEAMFIKALRTGKDMGEGRPILPPMPWEGIRKLKDDDLKAIFAYLKSLKPIHNPIHDPIPPAGGAGMGQK
jgi:mono/diheme cytochrome c family protein